MGKHSHPAGVDGKSNNVKRPIGLEKLKGPILSPFKDRVQKMGK